MEFLAKINDPVLLALASTCFTWFMTALGAGMVFFFKEINKRVLNMMLGFAAGIMVAASFWSLLEPAIEMAQSAPIPAWLVAAIGFVGGAGFCAWQTTLCRMLTSLPKRDRRKAYRRI